MPTPLPLRGRHALLPALSLSLIALLQGCGGGGSDNSAASLEILSSRPGTVTGGNALVRVVLPPGQAIKDWKVTAGNLDRTAAFRKTGENTFVGLVEGL